MSFPHWALCRLCNGNGCRECNHTGEIAVAIR